VRRNCGIVRSLCPYCPHSIGLYSKMMPASDDWLSCGCAGSDNPITTAAWLGDKCLV
jgi:hypothetical protein